MKNYKMRMTRAALTLLLLLVSTTTAWAGYKLSQAPMGNIDGCEGGRLAIRVFGWTCDPYYETDDLSLEEDCSAEEWKKVKGRHNWYLNKWNKAEIHVLKDGREVKVVTVNTNIVRNDVVNYYGFYAEQRHYKIKAKIEHSGDFLNAVLGAYLWLSGEDPLLLDDYSESLNKEMGFDTWIDVDEPGTYHVVVYGTNVHGNEDKTRLPGERDVTVANGYAITYDANTTDAVNDLPEPTYKSQVCDITIPDNTWDVEREGYTFIGWNTKPNGDGMAYHPSGEPYSTNADITLYAQWVRKSFFFWDWPGIGNYNNACTISSVDDWNDMATLVNNGYLHGLIITLVNDIGDENNPITRCIGTERYPFDNRIEGNGHTIYVDINDTSQEGTAPFRYMGRCSKWQDEKRTGGYWKRWHGSDWVWTICMLKVKGTVRGGKYCSGLVGISRGAAVILSDVEADVITNSSHCAGVIGYGRSVTQTICTVFSGSISGATKETSIFIGPHTNYREPECSFCVCTGTARGANIDLAPHSQVTGCFKTTEFGTQGTYIPYDPAAIIDKVPNLTVDGTPHNWCLDDDGSIIPYHQVYIDSSNDWDKLATRIANGASFNRRRLLILDNDITVGTMLGTEEHPFDGIFDGQNHTLTFNLTTDESGCAPFRYIKDAYIHDLKIDGTLEHSVGAKTRLAGVAAYTSGKSNWLENITVSSTIRSQASSFHHAGLVAQINDGRVIFLNCAFKGKLLCDANSLACGGLVAVNMGNGTGFQNCLFAPTACTVGTDNSCTISRDIKEPSIIINTCYTQELGDLQGSRAYTVATVPDNVYCYLWKGPDNVNYYQPVSTYIGDLKHTYNYNDGKPIDIDYTFYCNYGLQDAEKYTATIRKGTDVTEVTEVREIGQYTLSVSANEGSGYHGTVERTFYVTASSLPMNDEGHFLINSADDWNTLCELTSYEHQAEYQFFEGRVVELTADITVTQQLGFFCGTLAGNGHKLTLNIGTDQDPFTRDCAALIYNLRGNAVVENLHVDGTIITSTGRFAAGIAGITHDNVRINNCRSSIRIKTTYDGECHNGGLVGFAQDGKLAIENCLFDGCFTSVNNMATHWSGCVGVAYAAVRINSCLFFANRHEMISVPLTNNATFYLPADASSVSLQNCCHTVQNWGEEQQGTYVADNMEAGPQIAALGYEGWRIKFDWPQWQAYYPEGETRPLVLPRYDYHTAMAGHIDGLQGNGTDSDPYLIGSTADWNLFATSINNNVGAEAYYQLTEDITIDQGHLVGTTVPYSTVNVQYGERRTFRGTFDGNGHTLTLNMATNGDCAPFIYAKDCTIKNLTIAGSITTNHEHAAGLIVNAAGTVNITGCRGSHTINSSLTGAGSHGAFVAQSSGTTNIEGCVFDGSIIGATTYSCGGFVGERSSGTVNIDNSFFIPAAVTLDTENANDNSATFCVGNCSITNSYYTQHLHTSQGTALYSVIAAEGIDLSIGGDGVLKEYASGIAMKGDGLLLDGVFYAPEGAEIPIEKLELITGYSPQDATIAPNAGTYTEGTLTMPAQNVVFQTSTPIALSTYTIQFDANGGTGDAMANMNFTYGDDPVALTANTFSRTAHDFKGWNTEPDGTGTAYVDGQTVENLTTASGTTITLYAQWEPWIAEGFGKTDSYAPDGTAEHPYVISTAEEWDLLCDYISSGKSGLASAHYRLDKNLTVSRMMGTAKNPFRGTFEGAACTLTLDLTGVDEVEADPETPESSEDFENLENPEPSQSIELPDIPHNPEDVPVEETLHALAPFAYVNGATIKNLHTTGTINGETSYYAAGIVGKAEGNTTLQSCYSSVAITSIAAVAEGDEESPMLGGIVAQSRGSLNFTDCLFDGTINAENTSHCGGFLGQRQSGTVTFTNCLMVGELNCPTDGCGTYYQADETDAYTIENSYYHTAYGEGEDEGQGTQTGDTGETLKERLGESWAVTATEAVVPFIDAHDLRYTKLTLDSPAFPWTGSAITVGYTVKNVYNVDLIENTDFTVTFENAEGTELTEVTELGEYLMTINGIGDYIGSKSVHFYVCKLGEGEKFPFQIDKDFKFEDAGYYYVTLPNDDEANPKVINIPEGFTHSFKVYDDGGKETFDERGEVLDGRYDNNSGKLQIIAPEGLAFNVQGTIKIEGGHDYLTIYDSTTSGINTIFGPASGEENVNLITSGNSVIFDFQVDEGWWYEGIDLTVSMVPPLPITDLADDDSEKPKNEKNAWVLAANKGEELSISLNGRMLYRDGSWNTLCLPFDIPDIQSTLLRGATIKTLSTAEYNNGMLTMNFSQNLNSIEAGKPYIVKWVDTAPLYTAYDGTRHPYDPNRDYDKLLSGGDDWWEYSKRYYSGEDLFCEFFLSEPMAVTGYTMKTDYSGDGPINGR